MHLAADYGQLEVLEYLSANGADLNAKDKHGISVILAAIWEGHAKCVKFLLEKVRFQCLAIESLCFSKKWVDFLYSRDVLKMVQHQTVKHI